MDGFISKPIDLNDLLQRIAAALAPRPDAGLELTPTVAAPLR